jgi:hypothetical protein
MQYLINPTTEIVFNLGQQNLARTCDRHTQTHRKKRNFAVIFRDDTIKIS